jgi:hypothetical protein
MLHCAELIFIIEYFREFKSIFETALARESGEPGVLYAEKTEGRKSRESVPLNSQNYHQCASEKVIIARNVRQLAKYSNSGEPLLLL